MYAFITSDSNYYIEVHGNGKIKLNTPENVAAVAWLREMVQKGYVLNGRLLRPARVLVARDPDPAAS
jgi:ABC-type glycerol-3-phosphate transport system substrate-binding protein